MEGKVALNALGKPEHSNGTEQDNSKKKQKVDKQSKTNKEAHEPAKPSGKKKPMKEEDPGKDESKKSQSRRKRTAAEEKEHEGKEKERSRPKKKPRVGEAVPEDVKLYTKRIAKFCQKFDDQKNSEITPELKNLFKSKVGQFKESRYNIYWKTNSVGLHLRSEKKDFGTLSMKDSSAGPLIYRMAAVLKAAEQLVSCMHSTSLANNSIRMLSLFKRVSLAST